MEEISQVAKAHYQASTEYLQSVARDFFSAIDNNGDGKIDLHEFVEFMKEEGRDQMASRYIFNQLDCDRDGFLDFFEVMTLYYIIKSGRPFCGHCKRFIASTYLSCVKCLEDPNTRSFYLCLDCYSKQACDHIHDDMSYFLDNYSLLEAMTRLKYGEEPRSSNSRSRPMGVVQVPQQPPRGYNYQAVVHNHTWIQNNHTYNHYTLPQAQVAQQPQRQRWQIALQALNAAINVSAMGSSMCTIL